VIEIVIVNSISARSFWQKGKYLNVKITQMRPSMEVSWFALLFERKTRTPMPLLINEKFLDLRRKIV
jgi:hypothetical protein